MAYAPPSPYTNVTGSTINTFDPTQANDFLTNFNNASVLYSPDVANTETQANNLISAYQYLSDTKNQQAEDAQNGAGWSADMLQQLQQDIQEQQNLVTANQGNLNENNAAGNQSYISNIIQNMASNPGNVTVGDWRAIQQLVQGNDNLTINYPLPGGMSSGINMPLSKAIDVMLAGNGNNWAEFAKAVAGNNNITNFINQTVANQVSEAQGNANTAENKVLQNFTLAQPFYKGGLQALENFEGVDANGNPILGDNGQVQMANEQANQDIYQQAYQLKQRINAEALQTGTNQSGQKQVAVGNANANAAKQAADTYQKNADQAAKEIQDYQQQVEQQKAAQNSEINKVKEGQFGDLFNTSTNQAINSYNQNAKANNEAAIQATKNNIAQAQQNNDLATQVATGIGQGVGTLFGAAI